MANNLREGDPEALISVAQAAARLGVHPNTIRTWAEAGRLAAYRINPRGDRRFRAGDLEHLLSEGPLPAPADPRSANRRDADLAVLVKLARGGVMASSEAAVCRVATEALRARAPRHRVAVYLARDRGLALETHGGYERTPPATLADAPDPTATRLDLRTRSGDLLGALVVEDERSGRPADDQLPFLHIAAEVLGAAIFNARRLARARRELTRARALRSVTRELTGQLDLGAVLDDVVNRTRSLFDADKAGLWLLRPGEHPFELAAQHGISQQFQDEVSILSMESPSLGVRVVRERRTIVVQNRDIADGDGLMRGTYIREGIRTACGVPLMAQGEVVGVVGLYHLRDHAWPDGELALVQAFANQAAIAISNAQLYRSVADQAARMQSIQDLSARLNRLTDVQSIAEAIVSEASTLAEYHDIRVYRVDWESRMCEPVAYTNRLLGEGDFRERLRVPVGVGSFTGCVAENGEPMLINDALSDPRGLTIDGTDDIEESMLLVPMLYEGRALGVIVLSQLGYDRFTAQDVQTMSIFAGYAAQAIANATAYERLERQSGELARQLDSQRRLLEINEKLLTTLDQASVLELIADGLQAVVSFDNLSVFRVDREQGALVAVLAREAYAEEVMRHVVPIGSGLMGWAVENGQPVLANDALGDPRAMQIPGTPAEAEAIVVVPLIAGGEVIGALNVGRIGGEEVYFSDVDFDLVKLFAGQAAIAMRNADEHHAVSLRAETDALTGLGNHGAFQRELSTRLAAIDRETSPGGGRLAMLMMDLDSFKTYNDRHGHPAGDALLHAIATAIHGAARSDDGVYRYGGDEFALILPHAGAVEAAGVAERVRRAVARLTQSNPTPVTITVGLAAYPEDATDRNGLVAAADTALYYGKQSGEDRLVRADEVPREMHDLRGRLDQLARAALHHADEPIDVEKLADTTNLLVAPAENDGGGTVRDSLLALARTLEVHDGGRRGHANRVALLAGRLGKHLACDADDLRDVELAARLHTLDAIGIDELAPISSLHGVGAILRGYRALRAGHRARRGSDAAGVGAQIVTAANAYDRLTAGIDQPRLSRRDALAALRSGAEVRVRSEVLTALAAVVEDRPDRGQRRRRVDAADEVRGAA